MNRLSIFILALGMAALVGTTKADAQAVRSYNLNGNSLEVFVPGIRDTVRLFVISDTHLSLSDSREDPFRQYSKRMAGGYKKTKHFQTGDPTNPVEALPQSLKEAVKFKADAVLHLGDLISFPSEYGAEWALEQFNGCGIPWYYISGNHDWHYEGLEGSEEALREEWRPKRLSSLLQGHEGANYTVDVKGIKLIFVDDSINEVLPSQVKFLKKELKEGKPSLLLMHIPMYTPGRKDTDFTIGNPNWGEAIDGIYMYESRPKWREHHLQADYDFYDTALQYGAKKNLMGIIAGHVHYQSFSLLNGIPSITVDDNASGAYFTITLIPVR